MKILVTGGAGFIGSHLVDALSAGGHHTRILDNLSTGKRENLPASGNIELIVGDIRDTSLVSSCVRGVEVIVHLAAVASVQASIDEPVATHQANFDGTLNVLEAARQAGVKRLVYASSAAVYGDPETVPVAEDARLNPLSPYAADKLAGEHYLRFYCARHGLDASAFRFFNIYGPRQDPSSPYSGVISIFSGRLRNGQPVTMFGDGRQTRDFVYIADLVEILMASLMRRDQGCQVVNVGTGRQCSLLDLLAELEAITGRKIRKLHESPRPGDILHSCADVRLLEKTFARVPATPLGRGLRNLLGQEGPGDRA